MDRGGRKINRVREVSKAVLLSIFKARTSEKQASRTVSFGQTFKFLHLFNKLKKL